MSDKYLVDAPASSSKTRTQQRSLTQLKNQRAGQAKNMPKLALLEKERRAEGLNRSLFDQAPAPKNGESSSGSWGSGPGLSEGGTKAMAMMQKMGWKVGEGLGRTRQRSPSPNVDGGHKRARGEGQDEGEDEPPRRGIGSSTSTAKPRIEPIRVSLWAGRKGLSARSPSPPPLPVSSGRNIDYLDPEKLARLGRETDSFRQFQQRQFGHKDLENKAYKAREILVGYDQEKGVKVCYEPSMMLFSIITENESPGLTAIPVPRPPCRPLRPARYPSTTTTPAHLSCTGSGTLAFAPCLASSIARSSPQLFTKSASPPRITR